MRTVSSTLANAITEKSGVRLLVKAEIDPSRTYFSTLTYNYPYATTPPSSTPTDTPIGQCMLYSPYMGKVYTFIVNGSSGSICQMDQDDNGQHGLGLTANPHTKPAVSDLGNGSVYLFYWNNSPSELRRSTVNLSSWAVSGTITIPVTYLPGGWTITAGSPHTFGPMVPGENYILALTYLTSKGGIGCGYYDGSTWQHWAGRFMSPHTISNAYWSIYTAVASTGSSIFFYGTDIANGDVRGVEYQPYSYSWTDSFTALPADLSRFCVTNAIVSNGYVHLAGQWHRTGDLANAKIYSLVLRSLNGRNFSWDRSTLLSTLGYQFQICPDNTNYKIYASDRNAIGVADMSYYFAAIPPGRVTLQPPNDIVSFSMSNPNSASLRLSSFDERYYNHATIKRGSRVRVYLGYETTSPNSPEYVSYGLYIVDSYLQGFGPGERAISLNLVDEGTWKTNQIAFPFYAEILSKTTQHDDCDQLDRMYAVESVSVQAIGLTIDFWGNEEWNGDGTVTGTSFKFRGESGDGCERLEHTNYQGTTDQLRFKTIDLNYYPLLTDYPTVSNTSLTMHLYGWERSDLSARANSHWKLYAITAPADDHDTKTVHTGTATSGDQFPQEYTDSETYGGVYPLVYTFSGLTAGHVLLYIGVTVSNDTAGTSCSCPERIQIEGLTYSYSATSTSSTWLAEVPTGESKTCLRLPDSGLSSIMFTTKPYTAFKFNIAAQFLYSAGGAPLSAGNTYWGVLGLAADGYNWIAGRFRVQSSALQIVMCRSGVETVLASLGMGSTKPPDIMLDHRDGVFRMWYRTDGSIWTGPAITYTYDEVANGSLSTSGTGIMHTGILAAVSPPGFFTAGLDTAHADGIIMMSGQDKELLDAFPAAGTVLINGAKYSYTSKLTPSGPDGIGPYQGRQTSAASYKEGSVDYSGTGLEISLYHPSYNYKLFENFLIGSDNGYTWIIERTDWNPHYSTAGVKIYNRNRSKHFCVNAAGNEIGTSERVYINRGLSGISQQGESGGLQPHGSLVTLYSTDSLWVKDVVATQVDSDATVEDMLQLLCSTASVDTEFPGNWTTNSQSLSSTPIQIGASQTFFPGGCDLHFKVHGSWSTGQVLGTYLNNLTWGANNQRFNITFSEENGYIVCGLLPRDLTGSFQEVHFYSWVYAGMNNELRILIHDEFVSMYVDGVSLCTFALGKTNMNWPDDQVDIYMYSNTSTTIDSLTVSELFDWREAIYIESEMSAQSALGSVIQERPVEVYPTGDGRLSFSYHLERDTVTYTQAQGGRMIRQHQEQMSTLNDAGSDAIIYYYDIDFAFNSDYANEDGFSTRVLKLSQLETGAKVAAQIMLEKAWQRQHMHNLVIRPDIRLWLGDRLTFTYQVPGTGTVVTGSGIIEDLSLAVEEGAYRMTVTARKTT